MGHGKRYKVLIKGFEIIEEGTGERFAEGEALTYHNMPYETVCQLEEKLMGAFQQMNALGQAKALEAAGRVPPATSPVGPSRG